MSLWKLWQELAVFIQRYVTCDGHQDVVKSCQLKLLAVLKRKISVNLPIFLNYVLHNIVVRIRRAKNPQAVVSDHGLIKLIIIHELNKH